MTTVLDRPEARRRDSRISVAEYHRTDEFNEHGRRTELIRGIVVEKISKSPLHASLAQNIYDLFSAFVRDGFVVRREDPLTLRDSEPEPDVAVVRGSRAQFFTAHPTTAELVVEVAITSAAADRESASMYAEAKVEEYWIVLGMQRQVEVYRRPENGQYQEKTIFGADDVIACSSLPGVSIRVLDLFE